MSDLEIGQTVAGEDFNLPLEVVTQAMAVHGVRGKGKTVTVSVIVEEMLKRGVQVVVVDPTDVWWGLKSSRDGKDEGFPVVILGGTHGDLPLHHDAGAAIADFAVDHRVPMILSLRHLRKNKQRSFVTAFAEQLYHRKGEAEHRTPLFLAIDEASRFVPQRVSGGEARMVGAIEDIVRLGRASGLGAALIDQRPASVNKDVLTQIELLVCHAVTSPHDRKALRDWIRGKDSGDHEEAFLEHLASLGTGEAWFWMPVGDLFDRVQVRMRETFDSSKTPEIGEDPERPEKLAEVDLSQLEEALEETIEAAQANDPDVLKERVTELEERLESAQEDVPDGYVPADQVAVPEDYVPEEKVELRVQQAVAETRRGLEDHLEELEGRLASVGTAAGSIVEAAEEIREIARRNGRPTPTSPARAEVKSSVEQPDSRPVPELSDTKARILQALAAFEAMGLEVIDKAAVAGWVGLSPTSGGYAGHLANLRAQGLIRYPDSGMVQITDAGRDQVGDVERPASQEELHARWLRNLSETRAQILEQLLDVWPSRMQKSDLARAVGLSPTSGGFAKHLADMRKYGVVEYPQPGWVRAGEILFPEELD